MENGEWRMENGEWRMENSMQLPNLLNPTAQFNTSHLSSKT
jgi:hypothetical protein